MLFLIVFIYKGAFMELAVISKRDRYQQVAPLEFYRLVSFNTIRNKLTFGSLTVNQLKKTERLP